MLKENNMDNFTKEKIFLSRKANLEKELNISEVKIETWNGMTFPLLFLDDTDQNVKAQIKAIYDDVFDIK